MQLFVGHFTWWTRLCWAQHLSWGGGLVRWVEASLSVIIASQQALLQSSRSVCLFTPCVDSDRRFLTSFHNLGLISQCMLAYGLDWLHLVNLPFAAISIVAGACSAVVHQHASSGVCHHSHEHAVAVPHLQCQRGKQTCCSAPLVGSLSCAEHTGVIVGAEVVHATCCYFVHTCTSEQHRPITRASWP